MGLTQLTQHYFIYLVSILWPQTAQILIFHFIQSFNTFTQSFNYILWSQLPLTQYISIYVGYKSPTSEVSLLHPHCTIILFS